MPILAFQYACNWGGWTCPAKKFRCGAPGATLTDLRRTAATRMAEASVPRDHIAKVLNHVEGGPAATRVYDR